MSKTKFGVAVGLTAAAVYLAGLFGGYTILFLLAGYCLLFEDNAWLKKTCVKAVALSLVFSILYSVISLIPNAFSIVSDILNLITLNVRFSFINNVCNILRSAVSLAETLLFLVLSYLAVHEGTIAVPVVDKLISKYMD